MNERNSGICICVILCALTACTPKEEQGPVDESAIVDTDTVMTEAMATDESMTDTSTPDGTVDTTATDETTDVMVPDEVADTVAPDEATDTTVPDGDAVIPEGAYQQCDPAAQDPCPEPMDCVKGYDNAQYGQCLLGCDINEECPPPPDPATMQVACHQTQKVCLILCGAYQSECPAWLECFGQEMCLPPSSVTATKGPGEVCAGKDECLGDSDCIEGSSGIPHCYPLCDPSVPDDCATKAPGYQAQCQDTGGFAFCMFTCSGGVPCPGDLECVAMTFCQG